MTAPNKVRKRILKAIGLGLLLLLSADLLAQNPSYPGSLSTPGPGYQQFSDTLIHAIRKSDTTFVFSRVHPDVMNGFGYNRGRAVFRRLWQDPHDQIRHELLQALLIGGSHEPTLERVFVPYYFLTFPDSLDAFRWAYITSNSTPVYTSPDGEQAAADSLGKSLVEVLSWDGTGQMLSDGTPMWAVIRLDDGRQVYVQSHYLRSPIDYRFWFEKKEGKWLLTGWAAGD